ncbi:hypothetical protein HMPREF0183_2198 [Brevibacterium mcbrellneri ATCC 49030]|uniref:Uncharacterized protein n=1 Tax=Brevibacterium mcbrellneri ATCC 49030 TaxID=585530 RepID=D4YQI8_9MICO|nr:hypothetical protein HMPREF0183_2198 [Brevibacterium mcbrellneri ATCC 49030]
MPLEIIGRANPLSCACQIGKTPEALDKTQRDYSPIFDSTGSQKTISKVLTPRLNDDCKQAIFDVKPFGFLGLGKLLLSLNKNSKPFTKPCVEQTRQIC